MESPIKVSKAKTSKKTKKEPISNDVPNIYHHIPSEFIKKYHNPNKDHHQLEIPFRLGIIGASGSGKTQIVVHILEKMKNTFGNIQIYTRNKDEPIYNYLEKKIPASHLQIYEGLSKLPTLAKDKENNVKGFDKDLQHLVVFDDLVLEKDQSRISEMFIRGRKIAKGISIIYLSQSYFGVPKIIRVNLNYLILKKLSSLRDLNLIMSEYNLGLSRDKMMEVYKYCTNEKTNFLLCDLDNVMEKRFRHNLLEVIDTSKDYKVKAIKEESPQKESKKDDSDSDSDSDKEEIKGKGLLDPLMNKGFSNKVKFMLKRYGRLPITKISVVKNIVNPYITSTLNTLSGQDYDKLFHLGLVITVSSGQSLIVEKNATINIDTRFSLKNRELLSVGISQNLTMNQMINNAINAIGLDKFINYSADGKNCQDLVQIMLSSNNLLTPELEQYIKQDTDPIFANRPILRKVVNSVTDIGGVVDNVIDTVKTLTPAPLVAFTGGAIIHKVIY